MIKNTRWFELEPLDAWFFRDGRPSNRGEDQSDLQSTFPPHPPTVVGALRAALAREQGWAGYGDWPDTIKSVLGNGFENLGMLTFTGPFLKQNNELLFPMPRHVLGYVRIDASDIPKFHPSDWLTPSAQPISCDGGEWILPVPPVSRPDNKNEGLPGPAEDFFITASGLQHIVNGELPEPNQCLARSELFTHEARIGIHRDAQTHTTGDGGMYSPGYIRLQRGVSLVMGIGGLPEDWSVPSLLPMGGESRMATCQPLKESPVPPQASLAPNANTAILLLLTPAHFAHRWWGAGPGDSAGQLHPALDAVITTATFDRPQPIGGWDALAKQPRIMKPHAPPGTVWWLQDFRISDPNLSKYMTLGQSIAYGFGLAVLGCIPQPSTSMTNQGAHS